MKSWTQEMLPLKIIQDLGVQFATTSSKKKTRYFLFECPTCLKAFKATPSKVLAKTTTMCGACGYAKHSVNLDVTTNTKQCSCCKEFKPSNEFYRNKRRKDGIDTRCKECMDSYKQTWQEGNLEDIKLQRENSRLIRRYGITSEEYTALLVKQNYCCAICGNNPEEGRSNTYKLSVDHCHITGKVRGLLCQKCNTGLGLLGDTKESLIKALNYLGN